MTHNRVDQTKKKARREDEHLKVEVISVSAADAKARLGRAIEIVLAAAFRATSQREAKKQTIEDDSELVEKDHPGASSGSQHTYQKRRTRLQCT